MSKSSSSFIIGIHDTTLHGVGWGGGVGTPYNVLYREALPEEIAFSGLRDMGREICHFSL